METESALSGDKREVPITMQMLRAGREALANFDYQTEEATALVATIYWSMEAVRTRQR